MKVSFRRFAYNVFFRLSPILIVILLELALRFLGVGQSYLLFNESDDGQHYRLNPIYYQRFISPEQFPDLAILPQEIDIKKAPDTYRIFLLGDQSLCAAFPDINNMKILPDFTDSTGHKYEIVQMAVPLTNSFAMKRLAQCVRRYEPDACVVVTGSEEFYGLPRKSSWMKDIDNYLGLSIFVTMKNHRFVQVLDRFIYIKKDEQSVFPPQDPDEWVIQDSSETYLETRSYLKRNLKQITKHDDLPVFLVSLPSNLKSRPYRSLFDDKELRDDEIAKECTVLLDNADGFTIERWINELAAWEPGTAILAYCKAMIAEEEGDQDEALIQYEQAVELDAFRVRMDSRFRHMMAEYDSLNHVEHIDLSERIKTLTGSKLKSARYFSSGIKMNERGKELFRSTVQQSLLDHFSK